MQLIITVYFVYLLPGLWVLISFSINNQLFFCINQTPKLLNCHPKKVWFWSWTNTPHPLVTYCLYSCIDLLAYFLSLNFERNSVILTTYCYNNCSQNLILLIVLASGLSLCRLLTLDLHSFHLTTTSARVHHPKLSTIVK